MTWRSQTQILFKPITIIAVILFAEMKTEEKSFVCFPLFPLLEWSLLAFNPIHFGGCYFSLHDYLPDSHQVCFPEPIESNNTYLIKPTFAAFPPVPVRVFTVEMVPCLLELCSATSRSRSV